MVAEPKFHHRASLKQTNKPFKRRFATKNSMRDKAKGRTQRVSLKGKVLRKHSRADRRNAVRTEQRKKRDHIVMSTRIFTGRHRAPKIVAVIPLCADINASDIVRNLFACVDEPYPEEKAPKTAHMLNVTRFKQTIQFVEVERNVLDILDAAKVADYVIMGISAEIEVDAFGEHCLSALQNQGHPGVFPIVQGMETVVPKRQNDVKKSLQSFMSHFFPEADKVYSTETPTEALSILRMITAQAPKGVKWREIRPYMLADSVEFEPSAEDPQVGRLALTGYLRGANLSANRLIHIPNFGDYQIEQIYHVPVAVEAARGDSIEEDDEPVVLDRPDAEHQDSLVEANEPNTLNNEQTWPEDEEMNDWNVRMQEMEEKESRIAATKGQRTITVPKGTSTYQASWIAATEGDDNESDASDASSDDDEDMDSGSDMGSDEEEEEDDEEEYEEMVVGADGKIVSASDDEDNGDASSDKDEGLPSAEEEALQLKAYLKERERQNRDDLNFPDEVDTPMEISARERFARFRGLQSFRTSPWDPYENLPLDYARIFQFESFKRTQQRVLRMAADSVVKSGMRIRIILRAAPAQIAASYNPSRPFVAFGLMQHEHQMSVVHFTIVRSEGYSEPVRSKDPLVAHFGFRRYNVQPLFSQHSLGGSNTNGVHKFERFLKPGVVSVGTIYAPIQFGTVPVSLYLPTPVPANDMSDSQAGVIPTLVGTGSSLEVNPSRILAKRIILTGAPFKIHKRSAVIRYMFFSPEDVIWFKPVQLHTKHGRTGHIFESLGTHGYMKCVFDGPIKQMDTVCMNLYKRVYPKWNTSLWSEHAQDEEQKQQWVGPVALKSDAMEL
ncbi:ribosome biogenesis protein tsr1 [Coemansia sp. RSA 2337]|nr:ribosome biogenesis protein tsr1 [Coemansia sp. S3946]KAJ2465091.1 ribosome biogenesis protein tsr1 [Coemansia sp. RSA 2337]